MFEGIVAQLLNKHLGKYVDDLDTEQLNVGIFSGTVNLTDLRLKPEALAEFGLPIEVKQGCIAKISIEIPWTSLYSEPVLVRIEEVLLLAGPSCDRSYDQERDKRLSRAQKKKLLDEAASVKEDPLADKPKGFLENLATTIINNIQVSIQNVHIRYEDTVSGSSPLACGLVLQNLTAITTNSKWKATQIDSDAKSVFKLLKVESLSLYWNPSCPPNTLVRAQLHTNGWKTLLRKGLATFSINGEDFDFILKPVSLKLKMILSRSNEAKVPKLLLDFVLQDAACQITRAQFLSIYSWNKSVQMMRVNQRYRKYFSGSHPVKGHAREWWHYAYSAVLGEYVQPYSWTRIQEHRTKYRNYKSLYKEFLHHPNNTELRLDLQLQEDALDVTNILLAREQAKIELLSEEPTLVKKVKPATSYWYNWFGGGGNTDEGDGNSSDSSAEDLLVVGEKDKSWWTRMTSEERERLFEGIGYETDSSESDIPIQYIAHKFNFTLANCTISLVNNNREILVLTVTHFLSSVETRPGGKAFKMSARTESFVVEGASIENDLVPILTSDNITSGSNVPHVFALDFEKSPLQVKANYGLTVSAEPMEVIYHQYAVSELYAFFKLPKAVLDQLKETAAEKVKVLAEISKSNIVSALSKHKTMHLNIDLKSPYFVIPEHGSMQTSGSVLVIDLGRLTVNSDLQPETSVHEEATKMEVEERLYDRFTVSLSDIQTLFSDSGDEWRSAKESAESDIHLIPKTRVVVVFSNSVKPDCRTLPRQKLNISIPALKLCLSDRRVSMLAEFLQNVPLPKLDASPTVDVVDSKMPLSISDENLCTHSILEPTAKDLKTIRYCLHSRKSMVSDRQSRSSTEASIPDVLERHYSASDYSDDEECEYWARIVDLPGFEDNVSASNSIRVLLRLTIGEIAIHLARSSDHLDRPYLMLRAEKLCVDAAMMEYGPAFQASLHRIQLVDKLHQGSSGEYLELISSDGKADMITVLYRKVRANCPEFKSHFHQVEHSLVLDLTSLSIAFHREAFLTLGKFLQYVRAKLKPHGGTHLFSVASLDALPSKRSILFQNSQDPPVPPGATKFSISGRINSVNVKLCDTDLDLAELKVSGLECDYVLKANEKSVLRLDLAELNLENLVEETLYSKVISTEEDKVFDIKLVKNSPHHKEIEAKDAGSLPMKVDGSIRVRFGRIIVVLIQSFVNELQKFVEPFWNDVSALLKKSTEGKIEQQVSDFQKSGQKYQLSIDIHAPTFLFPQKPTSPNSLIVSLGDLGVENFFHEVNSPSSSVHCIDNILVRLNALQVSRAVILLDGKMEIREPILEPLKLRLDVKRALVPYHRDVLLYDVTGSMEVIKINVGQRDLSAMIAIYQENYSQMKMFHFGKSASLPISPVSSETPSSEDSMRKLEVFLYTTVDIYRESSFTFIMEGMHVTLYNDGEELKSSAVRDPLQALSSFEMDEVKVCFEMSNDKAMELRCSCQSATIVDCYADRSSPLRKIFQSYSGDYQSATGVFGISLSMPPMVDLTYRQSATGDAAVDVVVEKTRFNVSATYLLALLKFVSDALPGKQRSGYLCKDHLKSANNKEKREFGRHVHRLPSDSTSGYHSTTSAAEDNKSLSVSAVFRKPEIVLFAQPESSNSEVVVLKMDIMFDYSFNLGQGNFVFSVSGLHILSCEYGRRKQTMCMVLHPCDAEFTKSLKLQDGELHMSASLSSVNLCLSSPIVHTIIDVTQELLKSVHDEETKKSYVFDPMQQNVDLWSANTISSQKWTESESMSYIRSTYVLPKFDESFTISAPDVQVFCEISGLTKRIPVLYAKANFEAELNDWSSELRAKGEVQLEVMYYNEEVSSWEPLLEQVMVSEGQYRPWEIMFKVFHVCSHPIVCTHNDKEWACSETCLDGRAPSLEVSSSSSGEETEEENASMTLIKRKRLTKMKTMSSIAKSRDSLSCLAYPHGSDSENEDEMLDKIASTFDHLFSSDGEGGSEDDDDLSEDSEGIADVDGKSDSGETETADNEVSAEDRPVFAMAHSEQGVAVDTVDRSYLADPALYLTIDSRDTINLNVTPTALTVIQEVFNDFTAKTYERINFSCKSQKGLTLKNFLGPETNVKLLKKDEKDVFEVIEEAGGKAVVSVCDLVAPLVDISPPDSDSEMSGDETDGFKISSALVSSKKRNISGATFHDEKPISELYKEGTKEKLVIEVDGFDQLVCLVPKRTSTSVYALHPIKNKTRYLTMVSAEMYHGQKTLTLYSPLKVENHLSKAVHILCQKSMLEALGAIPADYSKNPFQDKYVRLTTLDQGQVYNVPLYVAYHCQLFVQPVSYVGDEEYSISDEGIWWKDISNSQKNSKFLSCKDVKENVKKFCVKVVCVENKEVKMPSVGSKYIPNYVLHLCPPIVLHNILPMSVIIHMKKTAIELKLAEGQSIPLHDVAPHQAEEMNIEIVQYLGSQWHGKMLLSCDSEEQHPVLMCPETDTCGGNRHLSIHVHTNSTDKNLDLYLFSPYWIVNRTGLPLQFRGSASDVIYEVMSHAEPLLFRFKKHKRKKAKLRIYSSHWSRAFSLDTVGNSGVVICVDRERNKKYKFFVNIELSKLLFTKIITIKPYFLVINSTQNHLRFMEKNDSTDLWFDIAPEKCLPFWPDTESMKMFVKLRDSKVISQNFSLDNNHVTVLRMDSGSALRVEVKGGEDISTTISFYTYIQGSAPVRVENYCDDLFLKIHQKCQGQVTLLNPYQSVLYTWDDPTQERTLIWNLYNRKKPGFPARIFKDGYGHEKVSFHSLRKKLQPTSSLKSSLEESSTDDADDSESEDGVLLPKKTRKDKVVVYWVSYMEKNQRVLIFTQEDRIAREARKFVDGERSKLEFFLSLNGVGISLVNALHQELSYLSLSSCPAIWEVEVNGTWKLLTLELSAWLEDKWSGDQFRAHLKDYLQVDLSKMIMIKPFFGHLRRFYSPALWMQIRKSNSQTYLHTKIHRFQVDNQLPDAIFPTVIYPCPTLQAIVKRSGPKPCFEGCILLHKSHDRSTRIVKYFKLLMQDMHLKLDKGFLLSVHDLYSNFLQPKDESVTLKADLLAASAPLQESNEVQQLLSPVPKQDMIVFEYVHVSPVKLHFSFSPRGTIHKARPDPESLQSDVLDFLVNSIGATVTEVKDVELKMAYFEQKSILSSPKQLFSEVKSHYQSQMVQQIYVLILGLDILGNPYGLVKDFTQGLGDMFYEPFMGSVRSPDEFAESLARGAKSLLGHVIGGSAGALSLISGSLGQALSVLTFDEEFRRKRQLRLQQHSDSLPESLLSAGKGFVLGVALGLSGVFVQPITGGAQQEGVEGFFRGIGKGLLGLIMKPAGGVMDMVSLSFNGIRRAAELGENVVVRIRLPRYINPIVGLRSYSAYQASGSRLLQLISKGHYAETDIYSAHAALSKADRANVSLITDKHVFLLEKCRFWGGWDIAWLISIEDIMTIPIVCDQKLVIKVKQEDSILNFAGDERYIRCDDKKILEWLKDKIERVLLSNMREKPCPLNL